MSQEYVTQVVLMNCKSFADSRRKFVQNVPVEMAEKEAERYLQNGLFSVRKVRRESASQGLSNRKLNPGDPFQNAVSDESVQLPKRKPSAKIRLKPESEGV